MKPLSRTMENALLIAPAYESADLERRHYNRVGVSTIIALEERGLIETDYRRVEIVPGELSAARYPHWKRTLVGENVALEISLAREAVAS